MAGEVKEGQVPGQASQGAASEGTPAPTTSSEADVLKNELSAIRLEVAELKALREQDKRALQGKVDKDIARLEKRAQEKEQSLHSFVRQRLEKIGTGSEEIAELDQDLKRFSEGLSAQEKAALFDETQTRQEEEGYIEETKKDMVKAITEEFSVEIPWNHPDLKGDEPKEYLRSATKLAKKLLADKADAERKGTLTKAAESGALSALGGAPSGAANPIANIDKPEELWEEYVRRGKPPLK